MRKKTKEEGDKGFREIGYLMQKKKRKEIPKISIKANSNRTVI